MDFEELQKSWKSQPLALPETSTRVTSELYSKWTKQQKSLRRQNIFSTIGMSLALVDFVWVYIKFHEGHTWYFGASLLMMSMVMFFYIWIMWRAVSLKNYYPDKALADYLDDSIKRLKWRRLTITRHFLIYCLLIWVALMFYFADVTQGGSLMFRVLVPLCTTAYIFGFLLLKRLTSHKKQLAKLDELIQGLQNIKDGVILGLPGGKDL